MKFDDELESLEIEAYRQVARIPEHELRRTETWRSGSDKVARDEASGALNAVIDFREHRRSSALAWAQQFATKFVSEIRTHVCTSSGGELSEMSDISPRSAASAVAAWIVASFGVTNPIAFAMATLIVLVLARALKSAFCTMSIDQIQQAI